MTILGPNAIAGSWGYTIGIKTAYNARLVKGMVENGLSSIQPKQTAFEEHNKEVRAKLQPSTMNSLLCSNVSWLETPRFGRHPRTLANSLLSVVACGRPGPHHCSKLADRLCARARASSHPLEGLGRRRAPSRGRRERFGARSRRHRGASLPSQAQEDCHAIVSSDSCGAAEVDSDGREVSWRCREAPRLILLLTQAHEYDLGDGDWSCQ